MQHKTTHIEYTTPDNHKIDADVDEKIAPLVLNLWKLGLKTNMSCQNNRGKVWIDFFCAFDAEEFCNHVAEYSDEPDSVYQRMNGGLLGGDPNYGWEYDIHPCDHGLSYEWEEDEFGEEDPIESFDGEHTFIFSVSVRFPIEDLEHVENRIGAALEEVEQKRKAAN
jgi:hypothetical protein